MNHKPIIEDNSPAIWRRVHLIPFEAHFVEPENAHEGNLIRDPNLYRTLQNELSGILNWAIQGCLLWQQQGLDPPAEVLKATSEYRKESDQVSRFLDSDDIEKAAGGSVNATELYDAYKRWCENEGEGLLTGTAFGKRVVELGYERKHMTAGNYYHGLQLSTGCRSWVNRMERYREVMGQPTTPKK